MREREISEKEEKNKKREIERVERKEIGERMTKSELARERKRKAVPNPVKEAPYPLVPSKKDNERYFALFLDIFKKLEIAKNELDKYLEDDVVDDHIEFNIWN